MSSIACAPTAGEDLYALLAPRIYAFLVRRARDRGHATDLLQETFLRMTRSRGSFVRRTDVTVWAFTIARRLLIDEHRKDRTVVDVTRPDPDR